MQALGIAEQVDDVFCKWLLDLTMPWDGLRDMSPRILIPVMLAAMAYKHTTHALDLPYQIYPLHAISSSATLRTFGIAPLVNSL